jgi:hypothetical protein
MCLKLMDSVRIAQHGVLDQGIEFIQKQFSVGSLTRKMRVVPDG